MAYTLGEVINEMFYVGTPGEVFTRVASFIDGQPVVWNPEFTDLANGWYQYTYQPLVAGSYSWGGASGANQVAINFDIDAIGSDNNITVYISDSGLTLLEARRLIAGRAGSYLDLEASAQTSGLTFRDQFNLRDDSLLYRGAEILFYTGNNAGERRRVIGFSPASGTLTLSEPALPGDTLPGDEAGMFNIKSAPLRMQQIDREINAAIREAHPHTGTRATFAAGTFSQDSPTILIPATMTHVEVLTYDDNGTVVTIPRATWDGGPGWSAIYGSGAVMINGGWIYSANGHNVTMLGRARHPAVKYDTDLIGVDQEWLVEYVTGLLMLSRKDEYAGQGAGRINRVDQLRAKIAWIPGPDTVEVR